MDLLCHILCVCHIALQVHNGVEGPLPRVRSSRQTDSWNVYKYKTHVYQDHCQPPHLRLPTYQPAGQACLASSVYTRAGILSESLLILLSVSPHVSPP